MSAFNLDDINTLEQDEDASLLTIALSLQRAINSNLWSLQGSYGRSMMAAIEAGQCLLGRTPCHDAYGNFIPSRHQVEKGTKGSHSFVVKHMGEDWAKRMDEI